MQYVMRTLTVPFDRRRTSAVHGSAPSGSFASTSHHHHSDPSSFFPAYEQSADVACACPYVR